MSAHSDRSYHPLRMSVISMIARNISHPIQYLIQKIEQAKELKLERAWSLHLKIKFQDTIRILEGLKAGHPDDGAVWPTLEHCQSLVKNPPNPEEWNGIRDGFRTQDIVPGSARK